MVIRRATSKDYKEIYELVKTAFQTAKVSDGAEQDFVYELRKRPTYIPELEFVVEKDGKLLGHIMLTKQPIQTEGTEYTGGLLLAPLCIKLSYRKKGIGAELIKTAIQKAKKLGYTSVFLAGDPHYYEKCGFKLIEKTHLKNVSKVPNEFVLAYEITENALQDVYGEINVE